MFSRSRTGAQRLCRGFCFPSRCAKNDVQKRTAAWGRASRAAVGGESESFLRLTATTRSSAVGIIVHGYKENAENLDQLRTIFLNSCGLDCCERYPTRYCQKRQGWDITCRNGTCDPTGESRPVARNLIRVNVFRNADRLENMAQPLPLPYADRLRACTVPCLIAQAVSRGATDHGKNHWN